MRNNIDILNQLLNLEAENYERLKEIELSKTETLIQGDMDQLLNLLKDQEALAASLQDLQNRRLETQKACAEENGLDSLSTLGDLVQQLLSLDKDETNEGLAILRQKLLDLVKELSRLVHNNEILIVQNLDHIKGVFNIVSGQALKLSYGDKGENTNLGQRIILDKSA